MAMVQGVRPLVDRLLNGKLNDELITRREAGESYAQIARWLDREYGVIVTGQTIMGWCKSLNSD